MVRETSKETYKQIIEEGILAQSQEAVYRALDLLGEATDREISDYMGKEDPNKIRPRRKELVDMGLVYEKGKKECAITGRLALVWAIDHTVEVSRIIRNKKKKHKCPFCRGKGWY